MPGKRERGATKTVSVRPLDVGAALGAADTHDPAAPERHQQEEAHHRRCRVL